MSEGVEKKNVSEEKKEAQIEKETEERMVPEKEYRAVVQVSSSRFQSFHFSSTCFILHTHKHHFLPRTLNSFSHTEKRLRKSKTLW